MFSTLHTNDAVTASTRLLDMGVEPFLVSSTVEGVMAQRLLRRICKSCKEPVEVNPERLPADFNWQGQTLYHGKGCRECRGSGYAGRQGIFELLVFNDELKEMVNQRASANLLLQSAIGSGLEVLRVDGWKKVLDGITTVEEVLRVSKA